ncbi:MAG: DUF1178 family protein [Aestuariivirgaceae bacterium]
MIHYDLICKHGHIFDGWFSNSSAYEEQRKGSAIACPVCSTGEIDKQLMAPGIGRKSNQTSETRTPMVAATDPRVKKLMQKMRELRQYVESTADYVGDRFAQEARRIHYNEAEERGIYGETTTEDARALLEEGIDVHPLPILPEEQN